MTADPERRGPGPLERISGWVLDLRPVRWLKPILDAYDAAGGGLLASGLAFNALFAALPAILLIVSLLGILLNDSARLDEVVRALAQTFPPLQDFLRQALAEFSRGAVSFSILGLVGLVWGSSRFYQSLDEAIARIFEGSPRRDPVQRGIRGIASVGLLIGALVGFASLIAAVHGLATDLPLVVDASRLVTSTIGSALGSLVLFSVAMAGIYRIVPTKQPSWRAIGRPAVAVGLALSVLTGLFALAAPRLVGSLQVYGAFITVFAAMIWLSYVAQAILIGAAWVHRRTLVAAGSTPP